MKSKCDILKTNYTIGYDENNAKSIKKSINLNKFICSVAIIFTKNTGPKTK